MFSNLCLATDCHRLVERTTNALVTKDDGALEEVKKALIQAGIPEFQWIIYHLYTIDPMKIYENNEAGHFRQTHLSN